MSILSGYKKFKRYVLTDEGYQLCSQWTSSNTVHFNDSKTAETKLGAINGITDSLTATSSNIALSSVAGNNLQSQINELNTGMSGKVQFSILSIQQESPADMQEYFNTLPVGVSAAYNTYAHEYGYLFFKSYLYGCIIRFNPYLPEIHMTNLVNGVWQQNVWVKV